MTRSCYQIPALLPMEARLRVFVFIASPLRGDRKFITGPRWACSTPAENRERSRDLCIACQCRY